MDVNTYLIDTNIMVEYLFGQQESRLAFELMREINFYVTKFSLDSVFINAGYKGISYNLMDLLLMVVNGGKKGVLDFDSFEALEIYDRMRDWKLDFDDAHLKFIAEREGLKIVTFDKDLLRYPEISVHPGKLVV